MNSVAKVFIFYFITLTIFFKQIIYNCCALHTYKGVRKILPTFKILISQKPHEVETLNFRQ